MAPSNDPVALLRGLLQRFSPSGQEASAAKYLAAQMELLGFETQVDEAGNAIGLLGNGPREVMLLGHIDTVPGYIDVHIEGDMLWGRGAVDAKGPLACMVSAAARVGAQPGWRLVVVGAVGEEEDGRGARFLRGKYRPDFLVIGEPSHWNRITLGYKGDAYFWFIVRRAVTHTATQLESAAEAAVAFWNRVAARCAELNHGKERLFEQLTPTLREICSSTDGFTETVQMTVGLRLPPGLGVGEVEAMLNALAGDGVLELMRGEPAYKAEKNTALVRAFLAAIRKAGGAPGFAVKTGTSDMNTVAPAWGCPAAAYGPGDSSLDHTIHEHISLEEYQRGIEVLAEALQAITSSKD